MRLPLWTTDPESLTLTEEQYDELPDQARKLIEVIDGHVIFCQSGIPEHIDVGHRPEAVKSAEAVHADFHEYAHEGIPVYLVVHLDPEFYVKPIQEHRLNWASRSYRLATTHVEEFVIEDPFPAAITFGDLVG